MWKYDWKILSPSAVKFVDFEKEKQRFLSASLHQLTLNDHMLIM